MSTIDRWGDPGCLDRRDRDPGDVDAADGRRGRIGASLSPLVFQMGHMGARLGWHGAPSRLQPSGRPGRAVNARSSSPHSNVLGTVLSVWAHPDDETYLAGGVMASCVAAGQRVACVSATAGEHGTADPVAWPPDRLARLRRWETAAAMAVLGVGEHRFLGFADGSLATIDTSVGVAAIAEPDRRDPPRDDPDVRTRRDDVPLR